MVDEGSEGEPQMSKPSAATMQDIGIGEVPANVRIKKINRKMKHGRRSKFANRGARASER